MHMDITYRILARIQLQILRQMLPSYYCNVPTNIDIHRHHTFIYYLINITNVQKCTKYANYPEGNLASVSKRESEILPNGASLMFPTNKGRMEPYKDIMRPYLDRMEPYMDIMRRRSCSLGDSK